MDSSLKTWKGVRHTAGALVTMVTTLVLSVGVSAAQGVTVTDIADGDLPGGQMLQDAMGWLTRYGYYACLAAVIAGGAMWGWANANGQARGSGRGQMFVVGGVGGALLIGASALIINSAVGAAA